MDTGAIFGEAFIRIRDLVRDIADDLSAEDLAIRVGPQANTIGWLLWHLTRVQDDHIAAAAGRRQVWHDGDWVTRFDLPFAPDETGYGMNNDDVDAVQVPSAELLVTYHDAVWAATDVWVRQLRPADLDAVVDDTYDPPVTLGVRLTSVLTDDLEHCGQAAFVKGMLATRS